MSRVFIPDQKFYSDDGLLSLYQGDDWSFYGEIVDRVNGYDSPVDLSQLSATGYFPSASGGIQIPASAVSGSCCGQLIVSLPAASTPQVPVFTGGIPIFVVLQNQAGQLQTVPTLLPNIAILSRSYSCPQNGIPAYRNGKAGEFAGGFGGNYGNY